MAIAAGACGAGQHQQHIGTSAAEHKCLAAIEHPLRGATLFRLRGDVEGIVAALRLEGGQGGEAFPGGDGLGHGEMRRVASVRQQRRTQGHVGQPRLRRHGLPQRLGQQGLIHVVTESAAGFRQAERQPAHLGERAPMPAREPIGLCQRGPALCEVIAARHKALHAGLQHAALFDARVVAVFHA
ncbi:hypothetical protein D3C81_1017380 [compost metagenome]